MLINKLLLLKMLKLLLIALKVKPKPQLTLPLNKQNLFTMLRKLRNTKLTLLLSLTNKIKKLLQSPSTTNMKQAKLRLPIIKLIKSIEIKQNAKFHAQFQKLLVQKIFRYADQQNQKPTKKRRNLTLTRNTLHIAPVLLS